MRLACALLLSGAVACGDKSDDETGDAATDGADGADGQDGTSGADGTDGTAPDGLPPDPSPFTVEVTGAHTQSIVFDQSTCSRPNGSSNLRQFWRGDGHVFVLKVEIMGTATAAGVYSDADHDVRATLQEEAGGSGLYFASGGSDTVEVTVEALDDDADEAWGSWTVSGMSDTTGGSVLLSPQPLPLWCPSFL